jgi:IclR family acetate operon transcriptional repressor
MVVDDLADTRSTGVQSVERAFLLLEALADQPRPLGVTELASASGLSLGTIHRLLRTLVELGYVRQDHSRSYGLGHALIRLGEHATTGLASWSRPLLDQVVREVNESVNLAVLENDQVVYVAHVPSSQSMRTFTEVGSRVPAHSTGVGKAMLAQLGDHGLRALLHRTGMPSATEHTMTDPDQLAMELQDVARQGFALDEEEQELGVRCVAVPVIGAVPPLAVSVSGPRSRVTDALVQQAVPLLQEVAAAIANETTRNEGQQRQ